MHLVTRQAALSQCLGHVTEAMLLTACPSLQFSHGSSSVLEIEIGKWTHVPGRGQETLTLASRSVPDVPELSQEGPQAPGPASAPAPLAEAAPDELPPPLPVNNSVTPSEPPGFESVPRPMAVPSPASLPVPVYVNGCRSSRPRPTLQPPQDFDGDIIGDDLDKLLDQAEPESAMVSEPIGDLAEKGEGARVTGGVTSLSGHPHGEGAPPPAHQYCLRRFHAGLLPDAIPHQPLPGQRPAAVHRHPAPPLPQVRLHWLLWHGHPPPPTGLPGLALHDGL